MTHTIRVSLASSYIYDNLTMRNMQPCFDSRTLELIEWAEIRNCKIELVEYKDALLMLQRINVIADMTRDVYVEYKLVWDRHDI